MTTTDLLAVLRTTKADMARVVVRVIAGPQPPR
jgi:hypothetical protein